MTSTIKQIVTAAAILMSAVSLQAKADITMTITQNTTLGGVNFAFSNGSGTVSDYASSNFLVGEDAAARLGFASGYAYDGSLAVLAGTNKFGIQNIFSYSYPGLPGTNGNIAQGFDFQNGVSLAGAQLSDFNGLVLNANSIAWSNFVPGTYVLPSYYTGYQTELGKFTLQVGAAAAAVPEPGSLAIIGLGLAGLGFVRRQQRKG